MSHTSLQNLVTMEDLVSCVDFSNLKADEKSQLELDSFLSLLNKLREEQAKIPVFDTRWEVDEDFPPIAE